MNVSGAISFASTITSGQNGKIVFPDITSIPDNPTSEKYSYITFGDNGSISQVSGRGALMIASSDDSLIFANGDIGRTFTSSNIDVDAEDIFILSDGLLTVKSDLQSGWGSENTYTFSGGVISSPRFTSTQATGTAPISVASSTLVTNLNADLLDGIDGGSFLRSDADDITTGQIQFTKANSTTTGGGQIYLNGTTGNRIDFNTNGVAAPAFTTRSAGTKLVLYPSVSGSAVDYGFGIEGGTLWSSVPEFVSAYQFRWYGGTTQLADLKGTGEFLLGSSTLTGTASQRLQVTGGAYVSGNLGIGRTNPSSKLEVLGTIAAYSADITSVGSFAISNAGLLDITAYKSTGGTLRFVTANTSGINLDRGRVDSSGNFIIGTTSATGTASQPLQVTGGAYVSGSVGIGTTNPTSKLQVVGGDIRVGVNTSQGVILTSANGTKFRLLISDSGALSTVLVP